MREVDFASHPVHRDRDPYAVYNIDWQDTNDDGDADDSTDHNAPLCFTASSSITITRVIVSVFPPESFDLANAFLVGKVGGTDSFIASQLGEQIENGRWVLTSNNVAGFVVAPAAIALWVDKQIDWRIVVQHPGGLATTVALAGTTDHDMHFVLAAPTGSFPVYYTLLDIVCRSVAGLTSQSSASDIADAVFVAFQSKAIRRAQDVREGLPLPAYLKYYGSWINYNWQIHELLDQADGQCATWAYLFARCLPVAGIDPPNEIVSLAYNSGPLVSNYAEAILLVKDWLFFGSSKPDIITNSEYPHLNLPVDPYTAATFLANNSYNWRFADVGDFSGVSGQGPVHNPASLFTTHTIVRVLNTLYDPSYGSKYPVGGAIDTDAMVANVDAAMAAYFLLFQFNGGLWVQESSVGVDLNGDGVVTDQWVQVIAFVIKPNSPGNQLRLAALPLNLAR